MDAGNAILSFANIVDDVVDDATDCKGGGITFGDKKVISLFIDVLFDDVEYA